jgi:starch synthase
VVDFTEDAKHADGIKFREYSARALAKAIRKALALYQQPDLFRRYRLNAMKADFSWEQAVNEYLSVYQTAIKL